MPIFIIFYPHVLPQLSEKREEEKSMKNVKPLVEQLKEIK